MRLPCLLAVVAVLLAPTPAAAQDSLSTSPPARFWHSFAANGGVLPKGQTCDPGESRLYVYGGDGIDFKTLSDFWFYCIGYGWQPAPLSAGGKKPPPVPGPLKHASLSCDAATCVLTNGTNGIQLPSQTWIYNQSARTWSRLSCGRRGAVCPSGRWGATMAYDPVRATHVLFGGQSGNGGLGDTLTFAAGSWSARAPNTAPSPRRSAAAAFVPSHAGVTMNRVVLFGGQRVNVEPLCDIFAWDGSNWSPINQENSGPCLHGHSMAWQSSIGGQGPSLIVTGGFVDVNDTANVDVWYFRFTGTNSGRWTLGSHLNCDIPTTVAHAALMVLDAPSQKKVFFGGMAWDPQAKAFRASAETRVCQ